MNKLIKTIGCAVLLGVITSLSFAQETPPSVQVIDGDLYTTDNPPVLIAAAPEGSVVDGALVIPGSDPIPAPTASVLPDGSLDLNNNGVFDDGDLPVPASPLSSPLDWMGLAGQTPVESNADGDWYYSPNLKYVFHWKNFDLETGGWFFIEEFGKNLYVFTEEGRSPSTGFFAFTFNLSSKGPGAAAGPVAADDPERGTVAAPSFLFFFPSNGVTLTVPTPESQLRAWIWVFTPHIDTGGTSAQAYFFREYEDGNKMSRWGSPNFGPFIKLTGPVGWPNN